MGDMANNLARIPLVIAMIAAMPSAVGAQAIDTAEAPEGQDQTAGQGRLEDIVVTAQRREERLQDVPVSVTAVTATALTARGITTTDNLPQVTPSLNIGRAGNIPLIYLRGVGTQNGSSGEEISVPLYVDGVYVLGQTNTLFSLNNIERIEVLRGPQGTLFGRNATGGLIQIVTRDPSWETTLDATIAVENYQTIVAQGYASTGLTENLAADLSVYYRNRGKGYGINRTTGSEVGVTDDFAIRSKLLWTPGNTTRITLAGDYMRSKSDVGTVRQLTPGTIGVDGVSTYIGGRDIATSFDPKGGNERYSGTLRVEQDLSDTVRLLSITSYQDSTNFFNIDLDGVPANVLRGDTYEGRHGWTQEIQLQSTGDARLQWVIGAFYLDSSAYTDPQEITGAGLGVARFQRRVGTLDTRSYAGFGQASYDITDTTRITAGLRYTHDRKTSHLTQTTAVNVVSVNGELSAGRWTYRLAVDQELSDDIMLYGVISRGFKSGGFNLNNVNNPPIEPETLQAYEAGVKSEFFDNRLRVNISGFYYDYKDIQLSQNQGAQTLVLNAAQARIYGGELEVQANIGSKLVLSGGMSLLNGRYNDFPNAPATFPEPWTCALNGPGPNDPKFGNQNCTIDATGNTTFRTPPLSLNLSGTYTTPLASGELAMTASLFHTASFFYEADNRLREKAYQVVNTSIAWTDPSERFTFSIYARNLFNAYYNILISSSVSDQMEPAEPRAYGASVRFRF